VRAVLILLAIELAVLLVILLTGVGTTQVVEIIVTATPAAWPTPTPDWSACVPRGGGWFWCP
jgi:hypothetical protein